MVTVLDLLLVVTWHHALLYTIALILARTFQALYLPDLHTRKQLRLGDINMSCPGLHDVKVLGQNPHSPGLKVRVLNQPLPGLL